MELTFLDWSIIVGYCVFAIGVGLYFSRRASQNVTEYFVAGRHLPWWLVGTSMVATSFAADTPLLITDYVRTEGISQNWEWWSFGIGGMFSVFFFARLWRRTRVVTDVEFTELRYSGKSAAALRGFRGLYFALPINCITMAWVILAISNIIEVTAGWPKWTGIVVCCGVAFFYCILSGLWGVVATDLVQFIIAMAGSITLAVFAVRKVGGLGSLQEKISTMAGHEDALRFFPSTDSSGSIWENVLVAFFVYISVQWWANKNSDGGGIIIQRMCSAKDEKHSLLATLWFNIANYALRPWPWILVALASLILLPEADNRLAYPEMVKQLLPSGLKGLMIASFIAAFMSTIDTHLNWGASYLVNDIYKRFVATKESERHYMWAARISVCLLMIMAGVAAYYMSSIKWAFRFLIAFASGTGLVYVLRWFWWRVNAWSEISAMIASSVVATTIYLIPGMPSYLGHAGTLVVTVLISTAVWIPVTLLTKPVDEKKLVTFYELIRPGGWWGRVARQSQVKGGSSVGWWDVFDWLMGLALVYGATLGIGKIVLGSYWQGAIWMAVALAGGLFVYWDLSRREWVKST